MSVGDTPITVVGNLTDDPELRFTPAGVAMARFTVASTPRSYDKTTNQWKDGTALFLRVTAWREIATNAAESLTKGMRVVATGRLVQHNWQTPEGENRSMLGLDLDDIGPSLRFATATVTKAQRTQTSSTQGPTADQWSASTPASVGAGGQWPGDTAEPPF